jgi:hypothetical protein
MQKTEELIMLENMIKTIVAEGMQRNIPQFQISRVADECANSLSDLIIRDINMTNKSPTERRKNMIALRTVLKDFSSELEELIKSKLMSYSSFAV